MSLSLFSYPEPFEEDETHSFPPNLPKIPKTSPFPPPVNHTSSSPTSSHSTSNTTAGPSGESCSSPPHLLVFTIPLSSRHSLSTVPFHHPPYCFIYPSFLRSLIPLISPSSPLVSVPVSFSPVVMSVSMSAVCLSHVSKAEPKQSVPKEAHVWLATLCVFRAPKSFGLEPRFAERKSTQEAYLQILLYLKGKRKSKIKGQMF